MVEKQNMNSLKKSVRNNLVFLLIFLGLPSAVFAAEDENIFGTIQAPPGVDKWQEEVGEGNIGIFLFISQIIKLVTIAAGIWTMFNFILAGWIYLTAGGDSSASEKVSTKMTNSVIGLVIVALSYSIAALLGLLIFGDADFFLNPTLQTIE